MRVKIVSSIERRTESHRIPENITWSSCGNPSKGAVFINARAIIQVRKRASEAFSELKETMGLLLGHPFYDSGELKLEVSESVALPVNANAHHVAVDKQALEFNWNETAGGNLIVGWYHSHTGQGNFLSETDRRTHELWFNQPHAVAMLIEASENTIGIYSRRGGALTAVDYNVFET